jgi:hypothetical protein
MQLVAAHTGSEQSTLSHDSALAVLIVQLSGRAQQMYQPQDLRRPERTSDKANAVIRF